ncbi:MAG TPA: YqaJ viral recombinase family protein [Pyrinomonadaceae bacterium]|nr:YqaJ viral recombinase family protein [Pyrinomonadaceae bacterium]
MIHHKVEQNSEQWFRLRLGIPTASEFKRILTPTGKLSAQAATYAHRLLAEWIIGAPLEEEPASAWMVRGTELQDAAVSAYEFLAGVETEPGGFFTTDDGWAGASPDRLIGADGILEIKCPAPQTHVGHMLTGKLDREHWPQLQGQLWVAERQWTEIVSYHPLFPAVIIRVPRDDAYIRDLEASIQAFVLTLQQAREVLENQYGPFTRAEPKEVPPTDEFGISDEDLDLLLREKFPTTIVVPGSADRLLSPDD